MNDLKQLRAAFEQRGYLELKNVPSFSKQDIWYMYEGGRSEVGHVLFLSYKASSKTYSVHAGLFGRSARERVKSILPALTRYMRPVYSRDEIFMSRPCWHLFDGGRALNWGAIYVMPNPHDRAAWPTLFDALFADFLEKHFRNVDDLNGVFELLLRDDVPFEWSLTNKVLRVAELSALADEMRISKPALRSRLEPFRPQIVATCSEEFKALDVINNIVDIVYQ